MSKKPTPQANKRYTAEFKSEAIKLAERLSAAEAAEKLSIYASQIYSWRMQQREALDTLVKAAFVSL